MENSRTIQELFEDWREQFLEDCWQGQDCQYENIRPFSRDVRIVHFYCENGESVRYDLIPDEDYNDSIEWYEEKKYFIEE